MIEVHIFDRESRMESSVGLRLEMPTTTHGVKYLIASLWSGNLRDMEMKYSKEI